MNKMKRLAKSTLIALAIASGATLFQPVQLLAQVTPVWKHCSPNAGAVGPFYIVAPGYSSGSMYCTQMLLSEAEAIRWACYQYRRTLRPWPQLSAPSYGMGVFNCP